MRSSIHPVADHFCSDLNEMCQRDRFCQVQGAVVWWFATLRFATARSKTSEKPVLNRLALGKSARPQTLAYCWHVHSVTWDKIWIKTVH
ncbi:MAG TPA: hypothetical protein ENK31_02260 [Nannocystis exedens]|nr:hypothetical protein [Nannocystis exedens]